jgi:hypothetical protein
VSLAVPGRHGVRSESLRLSSARASAGGFDHFQHFFSSSCFRTICCNLDILEVVSRDVQLVSFGSGVMGAGAISGLAQNEILELSRRTKFTQKQIRLLWKRFSALDHTDRGFISAVEFKYLPELICNPLADRILEVVRLKESRWSFATEGSGSGRRKSQALPGDVDFPLFVITMDAFHPDKVKTKN